MSVIIKSTPFLSLYMEEIVFERIDQQMDFFDWLGLKFPEENPNDHIIKFSEI